MQSKTMRLTVGAAIAAMYVVLTFVSALAGLSSGVIQLRLSEALTVLPIFSRAAVPGLCVGCFVANLLTGGAMWDVILGSLATLLGALGTRAFRKYKWSAPIFPIMSNAIIIPFVLQYVYQFEGAYFYFMFTVAVGEILSCGVLGILLIKLFERTGITETLKKLD